MKKKYYSKFPLVNVGLNVISLETNQTLVTRELVGKFGYHSPHTLIPEKMMPDNMVLSALVSTYEYKLEGIEESFGEVICEVSLEGYLPVKTKAILYPLLPENEIILGADFLLNFLLFFKGKRDFSSQTSSFIESLVPFLTESDIKPFFVINQLC
ncbi:MAG: hypothetical protein AB1630_09965 [bacterium]